MFAFTPPLVILRVRGLPQPAGSKRAFPYVRDDVARGKRGWLGVRVTDDNPRAKPWKARMARAAKKRYFGELLREPLYVQFVFTMPRPKGHFGTGRNAGRVKDSAPEWPAVKPDVLKLARAAEDALTGIVWVDDALICEELIKKRYGAEPGVTIFVYPMRRATLFEGIEEARSA